VELVAAAVVILAMVEQGLLQLLAAMGLFQELQDSMAAN